MKKLSLLGAIVLAVAPNLFASDIPITPTGPIYKFGPLSWGVTGATGFNNNFVFTPLSLNENVCVYVQNNDTTGGHGFQANLFITSDPAEATPSDGLWQTVGYSQNGTLTNFTVTIAPSIPVGFGVNISGAAKASLVFLNSATTGTANVILVQTQGRCTGSFIGPGQPQPDLTQFTLPTSAVPNEEAASQILGSANWAQFTATNPAANSSVIIVNNNPVSTLTRLVSFDRVVLSAGATAAEFLINISTTAGTGCTGVGVTVLPLHVGAGIGNAAVATSNCTVNPNTAGVIQDVFVPANGYVSVDLRGVATFQATQGIDVINVAAIAAGKISATVYWWER